MKQKSLILTIVALSSLVSSCAQTKTMIKMNFYDQSNYEEGATKSTYNNKLFYRNDRKVGIADPEVIYIDNPDDPEYGYFYMYGTSMSRGYASYRSKDLVNWENMGPALFYTDKNSDECRTLGGDTWAPGVIYDKDTKNYYMRISSTPKDSTLMFMPFVAKGKTPYGPFELIDHSGEYQSWNGGTLGKDMYYMKYGTFNPKQIYDAFKAKGYSLDTSNYLRAIDFHPFIDPDTGEKYLYFTNNSNNYNTNIYGIKMETWEKPIYDTVTHLTRPTFASIITDDLIDYEARNTINEGSWMTKHNGKYYLTLSINGYGDRTYRVIQAVADSALGPFRKLENYEGGVLISTDEQQRDDVSGPGHHSILEIGGEMFIVYHKHDSVEVGGGARHAALDRINWVTIKDKYGQDLDVMYANGPTTSIQPLPAFYSGYKNIASEAEVKATNLNEGSKAEYLTDGLVAMTRYANQGFSFPAVINGENYSGYIFESSFKGETTITLTFEDYKDVRALAIYNSRFMQSAFYDIDHIEFDFLKEDGAQGTKFIDDLFYDLPAYTSKEDDSALRQGSAAIAEFNEMKVKEIRINVSPATTEEIPHHGESLDEGVSYDTLAISDIYIMGK